MSLCDMCNFQLAPEGEPPPAGMPVLPAAALHRAIRNGFGPCISGLKFPKTGNSIGSVATVSGLTEADVDEWWRKFVLPDMTDWLLCTSCHKAVDEFLERAVRDTRRTTLSFSELKSSDLPTPWGPVWERRRSSSESCFNSSCRLTPKSSRATFADSALRAPRFTRWSCIRSSGEDSTLGATAASTRQTCVLSQQKIASMCGYCSRAGNANPSMT
jgi:hypothetical protein